MQINDLTISGDHMSTLDCIAPFGDIATVWPLVKNQVLTDRFSRYHYHRGAERGSRVKSWRGANVSAEQDNLWYQQHPLVTTQPVTQPIYQPIYQQQSTEISPQAETTIIQGTI